MKRDDGEEGDEEAGQVNLNVIPIRRSLPPLIKEMLEIGKVVVANSRPLV